MMEKIENMIRKIGFNTRKKIRFEKEYLQVSNLSDRDSLNNFITQKRNKLFLHAYKHCPYYHQIFQDIGLIRNGTVDLSHIAEIPILTKEIIKKHHQDLISDEYQTRKWYDIYSGGSTGDPVHIIGDDIYLKWRAATDYFYYKNILNIDEPTVKKIVLWGDAALLFEGSKGSKPGSFPLSHGSRAKLCNWLDNTIYLNSLMMTNEDLEKYIYTINSFKPDIIRGYAGSLFELCGYAERKKIPLYHPKIVVSAAENLSDTMRNVIESNFGTKVYDFYGGREVSHLAGECKDGLLHSFIFWNYLEVLDKNNQPVREGEEGRVVVTNLFNYSMPLIRYEIGDLAILGPEMCSCGQILPMLKKVNGRILEQFILKNGTLIHAGFFGLLFDKVFEKAGIEKWQVIQEDYDKIRINVVSRGEIDDHFKNDMDNKIRVGMGSECKIEWVIVDDIPKTPSGKYLYTKSLIRG